MKVEIRIYKQYDTDLIALIDNGYPVAEMMKKAVTSYANGLPLVYQLDEHLYFDMNGKKNARLRFEIPNTDKNTIYLLKNIKHRYRNSCCKDILRNALTQQNIAGYFANEQLLELQEANAEYKEQGGGCEPIPISSLKTRKNSTLSAVKYTQEKTSALTETPKPIIKPSPSPEMTEPEKLTKKTKKPTTNNSDDILAAFDAL